MSEEWREVTGFEGLYEVSSAGRVRSLIQRPHMSVPRLISLSRDSFGYPKVALWREGRATYRSVHRLVALAFLGEPTPDAPEVGHRDGDPANNCVENLRWVSRAENEADKARHGRVHQRPKNSGKKRCALAGWSVNAIRRSVRSGERIVDLAQRYGVHRQTISRAAHGRTYSRCSVAPAPLGGSSS